MTNLPYPPMTGGTDANQLNEVKRYLFRLVEELNASLGGLSAYGGSSSSQQASWMGMTSAEKQEIDQTTNELKTMIVRNAKYAKEEMEELGRTISVRTEQVEDEVGRVSSGLSQRITATDQAVGSHIGWTSGYIRRGVVRYDGQTPVIGIAIGQNVPVTGEKVTVDGVEYDTIDTRYTMSIWTQDRISFFLHGEEAAYFDGIDLHVNRASVGDWSIDNSNGFAIKWVGGVG